MATAIEYRGPDQEGVYEDSCFSIAHKRLAIIDLSEQGRQPMLDPSGRYILAFNGEIYNYKELRRRYEGLGWRFRTQTDTECILAAACLGLLREEIGHFHGIFAFALWDTQTRVALFARDRLGIKPLFLTKKEGVWYFASEIGSLLAARLAPDIDPEALGAYLSVGFIPGPKTIYRGVLSLDPGILWSVEDADLVSVSDFRHHTQGEVSMLTDRSSAIRDLRELVYTSIADQCVADRPVGIFLSGGLDSSVVLAGMRKRDPWAEIRSYTTRFTHAANDPKFNIDADLARQTAQRYGALHTEVEICAADVIRRSESIAANLGQPDNNHTVVALDILSARAASEVTVVLTGDGGDELFGGYERYRLMQRWESWLSREWFRYIAKLGLRFLPRGEAWQDIIQSTKRSERFRTFYTPTLKLRLQLFGSAVHDGYAQARFSELMSTDNDKAVIQSFMSLDRSTWLRDSAFVRDDRISMRHGLELRVPLTDDRLLHFARRLPSDWLIQGRETKVLWREAFAHDCLREVICAPKRGWITPMAKWLREPAMRIWVKELLEEAILTQSWLNGPLTRSLFEDHLAKRGYYLNEIWTIVAFQLWWRGRSSR